MPETYINNVEEQETIHEKYQTFLDCTEGSLGQWKTVKLPLQISVTCLEGWVRHWEQKTCVI